MNKMKPKSKQKKTPQKKNKLEKLVLNLTAPVKMDIEMTLAMIVVMAGPNDSGKSFILKVAYALGAIGKIGKEVAPPGPNAGAQFVMDNTFTDQNFNGTIQAVFTLGSVKVELKEGKVINVEVKGKTMPVKYMSTDMRTFDQMRLYLNVRKGAGDEPLGFMTNMLKAYRLYDVTYMEQLLTKLPFRLPANAKSFLNGFDFKEKIDSVEVDLEKCEFIAVLENGSKKNIATYGKGHQSILNMMIGSFL